MTAMSFEMTAIVLAGVAIVLLGLAFAGLLRQFHRWVDGQRPEPIVMGPPIGSEIPAVDGWKPDGRPALLLFVDSECASCLRVLPMFDSLAGANPDTEHVAVYAHNVHRGFAASAATVITGQSELFDIYGVTVTPFGVAVSRDGVVRHSSPIGAVATLEQFVARAREENSF